MLQYQIRVVAVLHLGYVAKLESCWQVVVVVVLNSDLQLDVPMDL